MIDSFGVNEKKEIIGRFIVNFVDVLSPTLSNVPDPKSISHPEVEK